MGPFQQQNQLPPRAVTAGRPGGPESGAPMMDPEESAENETPQIRPDMVCFRGPEDVCGSCLHWGAEGLCAVLQTIVEPGAGCNAFEHGMV